MVSAKAGLSHVCVLLSNAGYSGVKCFGNNGNGQLGLGDTANRGDDPLEMGDALPYLDFGVLGSSSGLQATAAVVLAAGIGSHSCIGLDGRIKCWGLNSKGQLGRGDTNDFGDEPNEMGTNLPYVSMNYLGTSSATDFLLAVGGYHTCATVQTVFLFTTTRAIKCWGYNGYGQLGLGDQRDRGDDPNEMGGALATVSLGTSEYVSALVAGGFHTCVLTNSRVKCWGGNTDGQLGLGHSDNIGDDPDEMGDDLPTVDLGTGRTAVAVAAGDRHTCAILDDGGIKCWGNNGDYQLGLGDSQSRGSASANMGDVLPYVNLGQGRTATSIAAGAAHTCAVLDNGALKCWGGNTYGQLGLGDTRSRGGSAADMGDALPSVDLGTGQQATAVTAGLHSTCAVTTSSNLKCFGGGGVLGLGDKFNRGDAANRMGNSLSFASLVGSPSESDD
ncbi:RCC1 and BTB domain-containing protein 2, partial [Tetrabaena socialis]